MSIIPEKLNDFRVFLSGKPDLKGVADLQLPSLEFLTETVMVLEFLANMSRQPMAISKA